MFKRLFKQKQSGFTVVELLIVVVVIAILATISVVVFGGVQTKANDASRLADVDTVRKFLELYHVDNGHYIKSDYFLNANAAEALATGSLNGLSPDALKGPTATASTISSWGQWYSNVSVNGMDYAIKTYTSAGIDCVGSGHTNQNCSRYELIYRSESDNSIRQIRSMNGW